MSQAAISIECDQGMSEDSGSQDSNFDELYYLARRPSKGPFIEKKTDKFKWHRQKTNEQIRKYHVQYKLIRWSIFNEDPSIFYEDDAYCEVTHYSESEY